MQNLNLIQSNEYRRFKKVNDLFGITANIAIIHTYVAFEDEVTDFGVNFDILDLLIPDKAALDTGITDAKTITKESIAQSTGLICKKAKAYAIKVGNTSLETAMNVVPSAIMRKKEADILPFVFNVKETLKDLVGDAAFDKYGITLLKLTAEVTKATTFNASIGKAGIAEAANSIANNNINASIKTLKGNLTILDLLVDHFEELHPNFTEAYYINSETENVGVHHSGIKGVITNAADGSFIADAIITLLGTAKVAASSIVGYYEEIGVATKDYYVQVVKPGFITQTVLHHVNRGVIDVLNFALVAM